MKYKGEEILNAPNLISAYRLFSFPFGVALIILRSEEFFFWLIVFNQFTDILDGFIARRFNLHTKFGDRLDSLADTGTYILALTGMVVFQWEYIYEYRVLGLIFVGFYLLRHIVSFIKFKRYAGLHVNSVRLCALIQIALFIVLFKGGPVKAMFYITVILSVLAFLEEIIIVLILKKPETKVESLRKLLKKKPHGFTKD